MTTLSNRIDSVATNILTVKQDLRQAILDKEGTVGENPTFAELKSGIEGILQRTTITYEKYYPDIDEIFLGIKSIDISISAHIQSPLFYLSYLGGLLYGSGKNRNFNKYDWLSGTVTTLYSFNSLLKENSDPTYSETTSSINIVPYDSNVDDITSPNLKYYFCQGNTFSTGSSYSTSKGIYSYDLVTNTASLLIKSGYYRNCFF